jgi:hypothetical protein
VRTRRRIDVDERRARLVARHHLRRTAPTVEAAVRDLVVLHSSDPITPPLQLWARVRDVALADLERALYVDRTLWRLHAMRRTLFVTSVDDAPTLLAACSRDVARTERRKLERWLAAAPDGPAEDPGAWLRAVEDRTVAVLEEGGIRSTRELTELVDGLDRTVTAGSGRWTAATPVGSKVLFLLALDARIVRTEPLGTWVASQYRWEERRRWFGERVSDTDLEGDDAAARPALATAYLRAHGPGTHTDLAWWTGWGKRVTDAALAGAGAVEVDLDDGAVGWVLPDDEASGEPPASGVALLPGLDSTVMAWKERNWYLGAHGERLFDTNGNAGPTVWVDGRIVGGWGLRSSGEVAVHLLEDVGRDALADVEAEAAALTTWLAGVSPTPRFRSPLERALAASCAPATAAE